MNIPDLTPLYKLQALCLYLNRLGLPTKRIGGYAVATRLDFDHWQNAAPTPLVKLLTQTPDLHLPNAPAYVRVSSRDGSLTPLPNCGELESRSVPMARKTR